MSTGFPLPGRWRRWARILVMTLTVGAAFAVEEAAARPGGGHSFSHSSGSSRSRSSGSHFSGSPRSFPSSGGSSHSSGSGLDAFGLFVLLVVVALALVLQKLNGSGAINLHRSVGWSVGDDQPDSWTPSAPAAPPPLHNRRRELMALTTVGKAPGQPFDPAFSLVLFEDFVAALYVRVHEARGKKDFSEVDAHLVPGPKTVLQTLGLGLGVNAVIVGGMTVRRVSPITPITEVVRVDVRFLSNYVDGGTAFEATEEWTLQRRTVARSRDPDAVRSFCCASCGAPLSALRGNTCGHCGTVLNTGQFDWVVVGVKLLGRKRRQVMLTGTTVEAGTHLPTLVDGDVQQGLAALQAADPDFSIEALHERVKLIFAEIQPAWSTATKNPRAWRRARAFVSDFQFQILTFWVETYRAARLQNVSEGTRITRISLCRATLDQHYAAVTLRVYAEGLDYTVDDAGNVVGGDRRRPRTYSEYWTLVRSVAAKGPARTDLGCPSCGGPLEVEMSGECAHCGATLAAGTFDWVLSRIEQDEVYAG